MSTPPDPLRGLRGIFAGTLVMEAIVVGLVYVGLIAACAIGMDASFVDQSHRI